MTKKTRTGIFGGSFDPPHLGHLLAAVYAFKVFPLDEIWFLPAYEHAFGKKLSPFRDRVRLCRLLVQGMGRSFRISPVESKLKNEGKMYKTLLHLRKKHPERSFSLVIGSDLEEQISDWYESEKLKKAFSIHIVPRGARSAENLQIPNISSSTLRRRGLDEKICLPWLGSDVLQELKKPKK